MATVPDDNLITRRTSILKAIEELRGKKHEIAQALRDIGVNPENEEKKELAKKLLDAYDTLNEQESKYLTLLTTIVNIHEEAAHEMADELAIGIEEDKKRVKDIEKRIAERKENGESSVKQEEVHIKEEVEGDDEEELRQALLEFKNLSEQAVEASKLNEKLVERHQLQKKQRNTMIEGRKQKMKELEERAKEARDMVQEKMKLFEQESKVARQRRQELEQLKNLCSQYGLLGEEQTPSNAKNANVEPTPQVQKPQMTEEQLEKRRAEIRENIRIERERKEEINRQIREKLAGMEARRQRVEEIAKLLVEGKSAQEKEAGDSEEKKSDEKAEVAAEQPTVAETAEEPKNDGVEITEEEVREVPASVPLPDDLPTIDVILDGARNNLISLTEMRERLEEIQKNGGPTSDDDVTFLKNLEEGLGCIEETEEVSNGADNQEKH